MRRRGWHKLPRDLSEAAQSCSGSFHQTRKLPSSHYLTSASRLIIACMLTFESWNHIQTWNYKIAVIIVPVGMMQSTLGENVPLLCDCPEIEICDSACGTLVVDSSAVSASISVCSVSEMRSPSPHPRTVLVK